MDLDSLTYYHLRERAERGAAKEATSLESRRLHKRLAEAYAERKAKAAVSQ